MTLGNIDTKVTELTKADSTVAYPTANRLINLNIWLQNVVTEILLAQDSSDFDDYNHSGYAVLQKSLVADQRDYSFGITDGVVAIKRVDVSYDGSNSYKSTPIDSSEIDISLEETTTDIDSYFSTSAPAHDWRNNALFLYPEPTASTGFVSVEVSRTASEFSSSDYTTGTASPGFDNNFHQILSYGMAKEYFAPNGMDAEVAKMDAEINRLLANLRKQYGKKEPGYPMRFQDDLENYN